MPQNAFFPWTCDLLISIFFLIFKCFLSTLHPLSPVIFATATVMTFVLLRNSRFNFYCYPQHEAMPTQKLARKWPSDLLQLLVRKIITGIHSCKPASLNLPTGCPKMIFSLKITVFWSAKKWRKDTFSTLHPLSPVIFATATMVVFVLLHNCRFNFHCYT